MADRLKALELVLAELEVPLSIDTVDDRLVVQKAVYLAQTAVPLGYSYGWYLRGPYSPRLAQDYYMYAQSNRANDINTELKETVKALLRPVKNLIKAKPDHTSLTHWLELLASLHYLRVQRKKSRDEAIDQITATKPHLTSLVDNGSEALQL